MKMKFRILCAVVGLLLCAACSKQQELPNGYFWKEQESNLSVLYGPAGDVVAGPYKIELWGKYPYIYGLDNERCFLIHLEKGVTTYFDTVEQLEKRLCELELIKGKIHWNNEMVNLYDLTAHERNQQRAKRFWTQMGSEKAL